MVPALSLVGGSWRGGLENCGRHRKISSGPSTLGPAVWGETATANQWGKGDRRDFQIFARHR